MMEGFRLQTSYNFELIIVNDGGWNLNPKFLQGLPFHTQYHYLQPKTSQFRLAAARNLGLEHATGDRVVFTDADCIPKSDFIQRHLAFIGRKEALVGMRSRIPAPLVHFLLPRNVRYIEEFSHKVDERISAILIDDLYRYQPERLCFGCNVSYPTHELKLAGGCNSEFVGWGFEDLELALRMKYEYNCHPLFDYKCITYHLDHAHRRDDDNTDQINNQRMLNELRNKLISTGPL